MGASCGTCVCTNGACPEAGGRALEIDDSAACLLEESEYSINDPTWIAKTLAGGFIARTSCNSARTAASTSPAVAGSEGGAQMAEEQPRRLATSSSRELKRGASPEVDCGGEATASTRTTDSRSSATWRRLRKRHVTPSKSEPIDEERMSAFGGMGSSKLGRAASKMMWAKVNDPSSPSASPTRQQRAVDFTNRLRTGNTNAPQDYKWLESVLESLARNKANSLGCQDTSTGQGLVPLFFVLGACPNLFCGMQVVMYSVNGDGEVDFWWVKPSKSDSGNVGVEMDTLSRHAKGPHKNDPGRSKPFYKPLADLFHQGQRVDGTHFGIEKAGASGAPRAFLEQANEGGKVTKQYLHLVWQEDWTSNPFARSKYIKGKIVYQKDPEVLQFFARQYSILNGMMTISDHEEHSFESVLPPDDIKELRGD